MFHFVPVLSTILPIIASSLLLLVIFINVYIKIRRKFPINVNCWFCNSWTKVPYDDRNSFNCLTCQQYNGFTKDGDYNKVIPEQHDELMNQSTRVKSSKSVVTNGLCVLCNNNQQLKIFQLAHFVPLAEENYDVEIEHFQEQLEKAYKLCKKCNKVLKNTLDKQNAWIFGNHVKRICSQGVSKVADQLKKDKKHAFLTKIDGLFTYILVFAVIFATLLSLRLFTKNVSTYMPAAYLPIFKNLISLANTSRNFEFNLIPHLKKVVKIELYSSICSVGLVSQTLKIFLGQINSSKVNQLLCWIILFLISWVRHSKSYTSYILFMEAFCCIYLLATAFSHFEDKKQNGKPGKSMRKLVKNLEYTCTDISDATSDFENTSRDSSNYSNPSGCSTVQENTAHSILNTSCMSAKNTPNNFDADLNKSLNNLHLGFKSPTASTLSLKRPKPVLSPPKFQNVNSWLAGGFWKETDCNISTIQRTNLSRSSSESSGFGSQHNDNFHLPQKSTFGEFDRLSVGSDYNRFCPSPTFSFPPPSNIFYSNLLHQNNTLIQRVGSPGLIKFNEPYQRKYLFNNWSDRINAQSFKDLRLNSNN